MDETKHENPRGLTFVSQTAMVLGPTLWAIQTEPSPEAMVVAGISAGGGALVWLLNRGLPRWFEGRSNDVGFFALAAMGALSAIALRTQTEHLALLLALFCWIGSSVLTWSRIQASAFVLCMGVILFGTHNTSDQPETSPQLC